MNMDAAATFASDLAVDVMDIIIFDVYFVVIPSSVFSENVNTKQIILLLISSVIVGDLQVIHVNVFSVKQKHASRNRAVSSCRMRITNATILNHRFVTGTKSRNDNRIAGGSDGIGSEHAVKDLSSLKEHIGSRTQVRLADPIELRLR